MQYFCGINHMPFRHIIQEYRSAYSGLSRDSWLLAVVMLINRSGAMVLPFMSLYVTRELHFSLTEAGLLVSLFGAGSIAGALTGGALVDRFGVFKIQVLSLTAAGIGFFCLIPLQTFQSLAIGLFTVTFFSDMFRPANASSVAVYSPPESVARAFSLNRMAANLGFAIGPALGGLLTVIDFRLIFVADGLTSLVAAFVFYRAFRHRQPAPAPGRPPLIGPAYRDAVYWGFILLVIIFAVAFFQLFSTMPLFFRTEAHLTEPMIGGLLALNGFLVFLFEMVLVNRLEGSGKDHLLIPGGIFLLILAFLFLLPPPVWVFLLLSVILLSFAEMLAMPFMAAWITKRAGGNGLGSYMALYTMAYGVSLILAPLAGTTLADQAGFHSLWIACSILLIPLLFLFYRLPGLRR